MGEGIEVKPGATVKLSQGGYHIMFMNLTQPLIAEDHVKATLDFAKAGKVEVEFYVQDAKAPATMHDAMPDMPGMTEGQ
jgi:copper(I)-binding protein